MRFSISWCAVLVAAVLSGCASSGSSPLAADDFNHPPAAAKPARGSRYGLTSPAPAAVVMPTPRPDASAVAMAAPIQPTPTLSAPEPGGTQITPAARGGKIMFVNANARYVVVNFPLGAAPAAEKPLNVFRSGLKVGELKLNAMRAGDNMTADLLAGEAQKGDDVRAE